MNMHAGGIALRPPVEADVAAIVAAVRSSLPELVPWMPWASDDYGEAEALGWIRGEFGDAHPFLIVEDPDDRSSERSAERAGEIVGTCGLNGVDEQHRSANLGYWVRSDRVGRGYATTATRLVAAYGIEEAGFHRLHILMSVHNEASRRVAEKAGAHHEGVARGRFLIRGEFHDAHVFSLVSGDEL